LSELKKVENMVTVVSVASTEKGYGPAIETTNIKDHANDPLVKKKLEKARETLKKVGLPNIKKK
jgi:hypothetical protein